jgi:DHA1 family bicyclomycin/chloramphenicol resistance-like MFS transporter
MAGGAGIGWVVGLLSDGTARPMATGMAVMGVAALVVFVTLVRPPKSE